MANKENKQVTGCTIIGADQGKKTVTLKLDNDTVIIIKAVFEYDQMLGTDCYLTVDVI